MSILAKALMESKHHGSALNELAVLKASLVEQLAYSDRPSDLQIRLRLILDLERAIAEHK